MLLIHQHLSWISNTAVAQLEECSSCVDARGFEPRPGINQDLKIGSESPNTRHSKMKGKRSLERYLKNNTQCHTNRPSLCALSLHLKLLTPRNKFNILDWNFSYYICLTYRNRTSSNSSKKMTCFQTLQYIFILA